MRFLLAAAAAITFCAGTALGDPADLRLDRINLPPGFTISVFTSEVPKARMMAWGAHGTLFVGSWTLGNVYAVTDTDQDGHAEQVRLIARDLDFPSGVAVIGADLYVADVDRVLRYPNIEARLDDPPAPELVVGNLPRERYHAWRNIDAGPDDKLYLSVGSPCDVCLVERPYAAILRFPPDGSVIERFAKGVRNAQGFAWHPATGALWFSDTGRNHLGDDLPAGEINRAPEARLDFGFPHCHGGDLPDPDFGAPGCARFTPPAQKLPAHVTPLGIAFYDGDLFPPAYHGSLLIAEHGSWDRSTPIGYRLTMVDIDPAGQPRNYRVFADGWLNGDKAWGRPVDVIVAPDGALLVSDDRAGAIYRISYRASDEGEAR